MDIKWKNIKEKLIKNKRIIRNMVMSALTVVWIAMAVYLLWRVPYNHYQGLSILVFFLSALSFIWGVGLWLGDFDRKHGNEEFLKYYTCVRRGKKYGTIIVLVYIVVIFVILLRTRWNYSSYLEELLDYHLTWIFIALLAVPTAAFAIPFFHGLNQRMRIRAEQVADIEKRIEEAVREQTKSERMKIELITNVSHDLKTPLTSVIGYIALMKKEEMSDVMKDYTEVLSQKTELLKNMVDNVFELARVSSGNASLELERMELNRLVEQIMADMQDTIKEKERVFKVELSGESTEFMGDSSYMYRIMQNLFGNAVKYAMDGTRIFVKTYAERDKTGFEIMNMSSYPLDFDTERIKERFVRGDESRSTEGNGLGLAIVETYTNALGGKFDIRIQGDLFMASVEFAGCVKADGRHGGEGDAKT